MTTTNDFRNGMAISLDGVLMTVVEFQHVKPGKGGAFVRSKLKNVKTGAVIEKTWRAGERVEEARLERIPMQLLYRDGDLFHVMDQETYEQMALPSNLFKDFSSLLKDGETVSVLMYDGKPVVVEPPTFVLLEVAQTDPGFKGDTAQGATKSATLETGAVVSVPLFVETGDVLKIDTRTKSYVERAKR